MIRRLNGQSYDSPACGEFSFYPGSLCLRLNYRMDRIIRAHSLYVAPLIDLIMPNFTFDSPVSKVYIDIQYGTGHLFALGVTVLAIITLIAAALPLVIRLLRKKRRKVISLMRRNTFMEKGLLLFALSFSFSFPKPQPRMRKY
ncbi:Bacteriophage SPP1 adsorption protein YueB (plasmid) [Bacillus velezensis]|nr:Bacteriophage SPP1 adsorption protein YueB [Bacillus velezensis]